MAARPVVPNARTDLTWERFQLVCATLAETGGKIASCEAHGHSYDAVRVGIALATSRGDPEWQELWDLSYAKFRESLEQEARSRARDGWDEPVFHKGEVAGYIQRKSDRLLELMLRAHIPERYRDNVHHSGSVAVETPDIFSNLSLDAKKRIRAIIIEDLAAQKAINVTPVASTEGEEGA